MSALCAANAHEPGASLVPYASEQTAAGSATVAVIVAESLDILRADKLVLTQDAVNAIHERFKDKAGKAEAAPKKRAAPKKAQAEGAAA